MKYNESAMLSIQPYDVNYQQQVIELILNIQNNEFSIPVTLSEQPDLLNIETFYDVFLLAIYEQTVVGTVGFKKIDDYAVIRKMFVAENYRGKPLSVATHLIEGIERMIAESNLNKIYLGTVDILKAAHRFYEKNGFQEIMKHELPITFPRMEVDTKFYYKIIRNF